MPSHSGPGERLAQTQPKREGDMAIVTQMEVCSKTKHIEARTRTRARTHTHTHHTHTCTQAHTLPHFHVTVYTLHCVISCCWDALLVFVEEALCEAAMSWVATAQAWREATSSLRMARFFRAEDAVALVMLRNSSAAIFRAACAAGSLGFFAAPYRWTDRQTDRQTNRQ